MTGSQFVYKIAGASEWLAALASGRYEGSAADRRDGFVHLSAGHQVAGTLARHFATKKNLVLIAFRAADCGPSLAWEALRNGKLFPHLYGALDPQRAIWVRAIGDAGGGHHLPRLEPET